MIAKVWNSASTAALAAVVEVIAALAAAAGFLCSFLCLCSTVVLAAAVGQVQVPCIRLHDGQTYRNVGTESVMSTILRLVSNSSASEAMS